MRLPRSMIKLIKLATSVLLKRGSGIRGRLMAWRRRDISYEFIILKSIKGMPR